VLVQSVAGSNYKISMDAKDITSGQKYVMKAMVHRNLHSIFMTTYSRLIPAVARTDGFLPASTATADGPSPSSSTEANATVDATADDDYPTADGPSPSSSTEANATVERLCQGWLRKRNNRTATADDGYQHDTEKGKSSAAARQAIPQGNTDTDDWIHVPTWAIWLNGAVSTTMLAFIIGLLYDRRRLGFDMRRMRRLEKAEDPQTRAASQTALEVIGNTNNPSTATLKQNPSSPTSTEIRSRSASREGVILLD